MKKFTYILCTTLFFLIATQYSAGQGCVAIRSVSGLGTASGGGALLQAGSWQAGMNFRYFHSFRHFRGAHEEENRIAEGSEVINDSYFLDFSMNYAITDRWFASVILPFVYHERSSLYEHGGNPDPEEDWAGERHKTYAKGLGDMRFTAGYWLFDPQKHHGTNLSVSVGIKLPTGDYNAQSFFYNQGDAKNETIEGAVDQSIQPGDGGVGASLELQGYHMLGNKIIASGYFYYLANPRATAEIDSRRGPSEYSVSDQYAVRLGASYMLPVDGASLYLGLRREAVPSSDFLGSSVGRRRPGFVMSVEPGLNYSKGRMSANISVPIAFERNRTRSYSDKRSGRHGDAAFADYVIDLGFTYRFGKKSGSVDYPELPETH